MSPSQQSDINNNKNNKDNNNNNTPTGSASASAAVVTTVSLNQDLNKPKTNITILPRLASPTIRYEDLVFESEGLLGSGATAEVYKATLKHLPVAVKKFFGNYYQDIAKELQREITTLRYIYL